MIPRWLTCCITAITLTACVTNLEKSDTAPTIDTAAAQRLEQKWNPLSRLSLAKLEQRTAAGDTRAQAELGARYGTGEGVEKDLDKALEILKDAAAKGEPDAEFFLGTAYYSGLGVPRSEVEAIMWFEKAVKQGHAPAQYWLAVLIKDGRGGIVNPNWYTAVRLLWDSAMQGYPDAEFLLGYAYQMGLGVDKNTDAAAFWYRRNLSKEHNIRAEYNLAVLIKAGEVDWKTGDSDALKPSMNEEH